MKILILLLSFYSFSIAAEDRWGEIRRDVYESIVDQKKIVTRISPRFIERGGVWVPGKVMENDLDKIIKIAESYMKGKYDKVWELQNVNIGSYGKNRDRWIITLLFQSERYNFVALVCNLKGEVWPIGKVYDEFDPSTEWK